MALSRGRQWIAVHELRSGRAGAGGLGPNLLLTPNGPFTSGNWTATALTETTGQTDPFGGTTASLLTDNATSSGHQTQQVVTLVAGTTYFVQLYFKPGTFTGGISIGGSFGSNTQGVSVSNTGVISVNNGSPTNLSVVSVGGFFRCSFNFVQPAVGANFFLFGFGANFPVYAGTTQTQTFWGASVQQVF